MAQNYAAQGIPLVVLRQGVWVGVVTGLGGQGHPLQFPAGESASSLKLDGTEVFDITGIEALNEGKTPKTARVRATKDGGNPVEFDVVVRIGTPGEADYYRNGGILHYVLRNMLQSKS